MSRNNAPKPDASKICEAFLKVVGQSVDFERDPVMAQSSMYTPVQKVVHYIGRFAAHFSEAARQREIAGEVLQELGVTYKDIKGVLARASLERLEKILKDAPRQR